MKPRADFVCLNKACAASEENVYELPVDATHCPRGHKRLQRLFNKVGVIGTRAVQPDPDWRLSRNDSSRTDKIMQRSYDQFREHRPARSWTVQPGERETEVNLPGGRKFIQPSREEVAQTFGLGGKAYTPHDPNPLFAARARKTVERLTLEAARGADNLIGALRKYNGPVERVTSEMYGFKGVKD